MRFILYCRALTWTFANSSPSKPWLLRTGCWSSLSSTATRGWATSQTSSSSQGWTWETDRRWSRNMPGVTPPVSWTARTGGLNTREIITVLSDSLNLCSGSCWKASPTTHWTWWTAWWPAGATKWRGSHSRELSPTSTARTASRGMLAWPLSHSVSLVISWRTPRTSTPHQHGSPRNWPSRWSGETATWVTITRSSSLLKIQQYHVKDHV